MRRSADRDVGARDARERDLHDREVAEQLVDERVDRGVVGDQRAPQLRVAEQHDRAERQHARGGLQPAGEQAVGQARELVVGDVVAVLAHQHAEHAVAGLRALALDHVEQVGEGLRDRAERAFDAAEEVEAGGRQALEIGPVLVRHAQQLADRQRGDRQREALHQVHLTALGGDLGHLVELARDDRVDPGSEAAQPVPGELRGEHLAQAGVCGWVGEAEAAGVLLGGDARFPDEVGEVAGERARRAEHGLRLVVAAHEPAADAERQLEQAHGFAVAQRCHLGHRVEPDALQR